MTATAGREGDGTFWVCTVMWRLREGHFRRRGYQSRPAECYSRVVHSSMEVIGYRSRVGRQCRVGRRDFNERAKSSCPRSRIIDYPPPKNLPHYSSSSSSPTCPFFSLSTRSFSSLSSISAISTSSGYVKTAAIPVY